MSEHERIETLNQQFFDFICYLVFMARQIMAPTCYGHFALVRALEKILEIPKVSKEISDDKIYDKIREELKKVKSPGKRVSSSDIATWEPFLDDLSSLLVQKIKENAEK